MPSLRVEQDIDVAPEDVYDAFLAILQARYAGSDLAPPARRATAVSVAMVSTTLGAVAGANLVDPLGGLAEGLGLPS